jgi:hypothetical protein
MKQTEMIHDMLKRGPVTPLDALQEANCFRLAARVKDLRDMGIAIDTRMVTRNGKKYAEYRLA